MATRADVAKMAGVSESTVTYALTGQRSIKSETKERILKAVETLQYKPNFAISEKSRSIALSFGDTGIAPGALEYVNGAESAATEHGYHLIIWPNGELAISEIQSLVKSGRLAGALLMETKLDDPRVEILVKEKIPFTMIGRVADNRKLNYIDRDFPAASEVALKHLKSLGHTQFAYINEARGRGVSELTVDVFFHEALTSKAEEFGMKAYEILAVNKPAAGREALMEILEKVPFVTAVVGLSEDSTVGLLAAANEFGVKIPDELSIISLSTTSNQIPSTWPALTIVAVPAAQMGYDAMMTLVHQLEGRRKTPYQKLYCGELEISGTTGVARVGEILPR